MSGEGRQHIPGEDPTDPPDQVLASIYKRYRQGELPGLDDFSEPRVADEIRGLLHVLRVSVGLGEEGAGDSDPGSVESNAAREIGGYRLIRSVGHGAMGVVYEAEQVDLGRRVALKVLPFHALLDERQLERFRREARSAAKLHHTNIVPVYDVGESDGVHYYAMQFIDGRGLDCWIEDLAVERWGDSPVSCSVRKLVAGSTSEFLENLFNASAEQSEKRGASTAEFRSEPEKADPSTDAGSASDSSSPSAHSSAGSRGDDPGRAYYLGVARVGLQVAEALSHAHDAGVLHRDIKPSNLLLDSRGTVWVTDFGLAKDDCTDTLTHTGDIVGTLAYMAPESLDGHCDSRCDVYSLGLTLYELLTLRPAYHDTDRGRLVKAITQTEPDPPRRLDRHVPRDLETIVLTAIAKDPSKRYPSAADLAEDLRSFIEDRPIRARRVTPLERVWRWCRRKPTLAVLILVVILGAGLVAGLGWVVRAQFEAAEAARQATKVASLLWNAQKLYAEGQYSNAMAYVDYALDLDPASRQSRLLRARLFFEMEEFNAALEALSELAGEDRECGEAHYLLAAIHGDRDAQKARHHSEMAEQLLADTPDAYHLRSLSARSWEAALKLLEEGIKKDPSHFPCRLGKAFARYALHDLDGCEDDAAVAIGLRTHDARGWQLRAVARRELGRLDAALDDHNKAVRLAPFDAEVYNQRRQTLHLLGRHADELADAEECLNLDRRPLLYLLNRMSALLCMSDFARLGVAWDELVSTRPAHQGRALAWLQKRAIDLLEQGGFPESLPLEEGREALLALGRARDLYMHLQGRAVRLVSRGFRVAWSADAQHVAYTRGDRTTPGLYEGEASKSPTRFRGLGGIEVMNLETGDVRLLTPSGKDPSWSPDGRHIAFVREPWIHAYHEEEVWVVPASGGTERRLATGGFPLWSADSTRVLFHDRAEEALYSIRLDEPQAKPVKVRDCPGWYPAISPDEKHLAYSLGKKVFIVEMETKRVVQTWVGPQNESGLLILWSPDGRELSIGGFDRSTFGLWILDLASGSARKVLNGPITLGAWSPDGSRLAFDVRGPFFEIWITVIQDGVTTADALGFSREVRGVPGPPADLEPSTEAERSDYADRVRYLEREMRLYGGSPLLHERLEQYREALYPDLPTYRSIDERIQELIDGPVALALADSDSSSAEDRVRANMRLFEDFCAFTLQYPGGAGRVAYLQGRLHALADRHREAVEFFVRACEEWPGTEPVLRLVESARLSGRTVGAEKYLRQLLAAGLPDKELLRVVGELWLSVAFADLRIEPGDLLPDFPLVPEGSDEGLLADFCWLLGKLAAEEPVRLNCGGGSRISPEGPAWSRDRFFVGGRIYGGPGGTSVYFGDIADTEEDYLYQTERWFPPEGPIRPGYRIPVPPGTYEVRLLFAEIYFEATGKRVFDVTLEGHVELEDLDPCSEGPARALERSIEGSVTDGILDLGFLRKPGRNNPKVSAIEIRRVD